MTPEATTDNDNARDTQFRPRRLWRRFLLLLPLTVVLAIASFLYIRPVADTYTVAGILTYDADEFEAGTVTFGTPGVVEVVATERTHLGTPRVTFRALADGTTSVSFAAGDSSQLWQLEVRNGAIIEGGINFNGWRAIEASVIVLVAALIACFGSAFWELWRRSWYGYEMVACGGALLFFLFQFFVLLYLALFGGTPTFFDFLTDVLQMADAFSALSILFMVPLALFVSVSNVALIRHEGLRPVNLLGIAASLTWTVAYAFWLFGFDILDGRVPMRVAMQLDTLVGLAIAFGECLLLSTMLCAWLSSRHVPAHGVDYLVVLGCGIRKDGTPCPLLAGRVDRAVAFDEERQTAGDAPAVFVPSGGQGPDEPVSEAESMRGYLVGQRGIAPERIACEDRSTTTRENMAFSREVIERHAGCDASALRVAFSTTNYHVFRGYVCAREAGMDVEGMGSKTKYYFWPNAFLREFLGLLVGQWAMVAQTYALIAFAHAVAQYVLMLV